MTSNGLGTIPAVKTVGSFLADLSKRIPPSGAASWDVNGLQLGDGKASIASVGVCHEVTDEVVRLVAQNPVDLLITYHPLLFRPTTTVVAGPGPSGRAFEILRSGVSLAVAHTSFDVVEGGTADSLAAALDLAEITGFGNNVNEDQVKVVTFAPADSIEGIAAAMAAAGAGAIGNYEACSFRVEGVGSFEPGPDASPVTGRVGEINVEPETRIEMVAPSRTRDGIVAALIAAHPYEQPAFDVYPVSSNTGFIGRIGRWQGTLEGLGSLVGDRLGRAGLRVSGEQTTSVETVAVVPGSGADFIPAARQSGADVIVTGDVSHHRIVAALDGGMAVIDPGHTPSERPGIARLLAVTTEVAAGELEVIDFTYADPTPWR